MKRIVFNGCWVGTNVVGVSRYAYNIIKELDKLLDGSKDKYYVELLVPADAVECDLGFNNITIVKRGQCTGKVNKIFWEQVVFPHYVKETKGVGVDLTLSIPVHGIKYMLLGYIFDASLGTAVIGAEPGNQVIGALLKQYETAEYQYKPETRDFKIKFEFMPEMFMVNNNDMFTAYFLKNVKGFALTGKKCRCGDDGKIHIYPKEYFEGYSMHFKNNYSIHHCFGSWRYFENENEKHDESILRNYLKNIYFLRWAKDKYIRMKKKNLPFQNYFVRR